MNSRIIAGLPAEKQNPPGRSRAGSARSRRGSPASLLAVLAQSRDLRRDSQQLALRQRQVDIALGVLHRFLGSLLGLVRLGFVEVLAADGRIGQHRHRSGLDLEDAAGDEDKLFLAVVGALDAHGSRLDPGDERRMPGVDAELAHLARPRRALRLAGEDPFLGRDDFDVERGHDRVSYWIVLAFSMASSIEPTM